MAETTTPGQSNNRRRIIARLRRQPQPIEIKLKVKSDTQIDLHPNSANSTSTQPTPAKASLGRQPDSANNNLPESPYGTNTSSPNDNQGPAGYPNAPNQSLASQAPAGAPPTDQPANKPDENNPANQTGAAPAGDPYDSPGNQSSPSAGKNSDGPGQGEAGGKPGVAKSTERPQTAGNEAADTGSDAQDKAPERAEPDFYGGDGAPKEGNTGSPTDDLASREAAPNNEQTPDQEKEPLSLAQKEAVYDRPGNQPTAPPGKSNKKDDSSKPDSKTPKEKGGQQDEEEHDKKSDSDDTLGKGYRPGKKSRAGQMSSLLKNRLAMGLVGVFAIGALVFFGGILSAFKLNGIMENVSARTFARLQGVENRRSISWMSAYLQFRLMDIGDNPDLNKGAASENMLFRSERVASGNPALDWYRTLRSSSFEQDVFEKNGIKFTSVYTKDGKIRAGLIDINGRKLIPNSVLKDSDLLAIQNGDVKALNKYRDYLDVQVFGSDKEARREIRKVVWDNTQDWQVFKRRQIRKSIQNMTGVRDWRFFEGTRNKITDKKIDIRNKIIKKAVPESTSTGKFVQCLFGITDCKSLNGDTASPDNQAAGSPSETPTNPDEPITGKDSDGKPIKISVGPEEKAAALKKITSDVLQKVTPVIGALNLVQTLDSFSSVNKAILSGKLSQAVAMARGVQAMGLYQVYQTAADQTKAGDVNTSELNDFMGTVSTAASSEGWVSVVEGKGNGAPAATGAAPTTQTLSAKASATDKANLYCSPESQAKLDKDPSLADTKPEIYGYAYQCPNQQIGGGNNARKLEETYKATVGQPIGKILSVYDGVRKAPIIGDLLDLGKSILYGVYQKTFEIAIKPIMDATGLTGQVDKAMGYISYKLMAFMGGGPIISGQEPPGVFMNWIIQGGAFTAETTARSMGGSLTTAQSMKQSQIALADFENNRPDAQSLNDRLFASSNPNSLASKTSLALVNFSPSKVVADLFSFKWLSNVFGFAFHPVGASDINGYTADNFAGIQTYDFPNACYGDPLTATPVGSTNIQAVLPGANIADSELTWDLVTNSDKWYAYVYSKTQDENKTKQIYNCALLDTAIRGSIGYLYGYNKDNGLDTTTGNVVTADSSSGNTIDVSALPDDSTNIPCAAGARDIGNTTGYTSGKPVKIKLCALPNIKSPSEESTGGYGITDAKGQAIVNSRVSGAFYAMAEAAKKDGITLQATSTFRTMSHQQSLCATNSLCVGGDYSQVAKPGTSNHQLGIAIDFGTDSGSTISKGDKWFNWLNSNAAKFGIKNYPAENWHWSPTGN